MGALLLANGIFVGVIDIRSSCCAITYDEIMGRLAVGTV